MQVQFAEKRQLVQFYVNAVEDKEASLKEGRPVFRDTPFVKIFTPGDKDTIIDQPVWDDPTHPYSHTSRYPAEWAAFKAGQMDQVSGTPLDLMPGITKARVEELKQLHIRTVEHLAEVADAHAQRFMGLQALKQQAREYLERAKGAAPEKQLRDELSKRDNEIATLKAQMAELVAAVNAKKK